MNEKKYELTDETKTEEEYEDLQYDYKYLVGSLFGKMYDAEMDCKYYYDIEQKNGELLPEENGEYNRALDEYYQFREILRDNSLLKRYREYKETGVV